MLTWILIFLVIATIAAIFGFGGTAGLTATAGQMLFYIFALCFVFTLVINALRRKHK